VLHIIRKGSGRKKGYVSIYQEWDPPAQGDTAMIQVEARINDHQLKTTGRWSRRIQKQPVILFICSCTVLKNVFMIGV